MKALQDSLLDRGQTPNHGSANARKHFGLSGPSVVLDRRVNAVRGDIADVALAGILFAPHYARPMERRCIVPAASLRDKPSEQGNQISELLHGEAFQVLELSGGWAWGYCEHDHYVGYVSAEALAMAAKGEWRVSSAQADLLDAAAPDATPVRTLSMGAFIDGTADGDYILTDEGAIARRDVSPIDTRLNPVDQAEKLLGAPYRMGGRSFDGIDCSGLVQIALSFAGIEAPRDSDLQANALGTALPEGAALERGDLVFFPNHVGMMVDAERIIHANGLTMNVVVEPLSELRARVAENDIADMKATRP